MEQQIGSLGVADETYAKGVASAAAQLALPVTAFGLSGSVQVKMDLDAKILIGYLAAKIGGPIPAEVATFLESALAVI